MTWTTVAPYVISGLTLAFSIYQFRRKVDVDAAAAEENTIAGLERRLADCERKNRDAERRISDLRSTNMWLTDRVVELERAARQKAG